MLEEIEHSEFVLQLPGRYLLLFSKNLFTVCEM